MTTLQGSGIFQPATIEAIQAKADTGLYAGPAAPEVEGAGIDWGNTWLPMGLGLLIVFGIGHGLRRVWPRIDPA